MAHRNTLSNDVLHKYVEIIIIIVIIIIITTTTTTIANFVLAVISDQWLALDYSPNYGYIYRICWSEIWVHLSSIEPISILRVSLRFRVEGGNHQVGGGHCRQDAVPKAVPGGLGASPRKFLHLGGLRSILGLKFDSHSNDGNHHITGLVITGT